MAAAKPKHFLVVDKDDVSTIVKAGTEAQVCAHLCATRFPTIRIATQDDLVALMPAPIEVAGETPTTPAEEMPF